MKDYKRYGIQVGQVYQRTDGSPESVVVSDVETYANQGDVVVLDKRAVPIRIDCFKLAQCHYYLEI